MCPTCVNAKMCDLPLLHTLRLMYMLMKSKCVNKSCMYKCIRYVMNNVTLAAYTVGITQYIVFVFAVTLEDL